MDNSEIGNAGFVITFLSLFINLSDIDKLTSIAAGLVAICCGTITTIYYYNKNKALQNGRSKKHSDGQHASGKRR